MLHALKTLLKVDFGGLHTFVDKTLCNPLRNITSIACVERTCQHCGFKMISDIFKGLDPETPMAWFKWGRNEGDTRVKNIAVEGSLGTFREQLELLVNPLAKHLFVAR